MSLRINLMVEDELRYQGAVSRVFLAKLLIGLVLASIALWGGLLVQQQMAVRAELAQLQGDWSKVEARFNLIKRKRADLARWQGYKAELDRWSSIRVEWADRLEELHAMVPPSAQLVRIAIRNDWEFIRAGVPAVPAGESAESAAPKTPAPPVPVRNFSLAISGKAAGDEGANAVLDMSNALKAVPGYRDLFETMKLQRLVRDPNPLDQADRSFDIECQAPARKLE